MRYELIKLLDPFVEKFHTEIIFRPSDKPKIVMQ